MIILASLLFLVCTRSDSFNATDEWPDIIEPPRETGRCDASWAVSYASVIADRMGLKGCKVNRLSIQDLLSCDQIDNRCYGANFQKIFLYAKNNGIAEEECLPYASSDGRIPMCRNICQDKTKVVRWKVDEITTFNSTSVMNEIRNNGPVFIKMDYYEDFKKYRGGIYQHMDGKKLGTIGLKLTGWGEENGKKYWIVEGAWGVTWGENGYAKIIRGKNECNCESLMVAPQKLCIKE